MSQENEARRIIERQDALNREVRKWLRLNRKELIRRIASLDLRERVSLLSGNPKLIKSIKSRSKKRDGFFQWLAFSFVKHGIFLEHGVGRGRKKGSASARKHAKKWLKPVLEPAFEELADLFGEQYADLIEDFILAQIPGIINFEDGK